MDFALTDRGLEFNFQRRESGADAAEASSTSTNGATATTPGVGSTASDVPNVQQQSLLSLLGAAVSPNASTASLNPSKAASTSVNPLLALLQAGSSSTTAPVPAFVLDARAVEQQQKQLKAVETRKEEQPRPAVEHFKAVEKQQQQRPRQQPAIPRVSTLNVDAMINSDALPVPHLLRSSTVALMTRPERYQRGRLADVTSRLIAYSKDRNVRLIQQSDGVFVLLKRHQAPIVDMAFAPVVIKSGAPTSAPSYLCTIGEDALLVVWEVGQMRTCRCIYVCFTLYRIPASD